MKTEELAQGWNTSTTRESNTGRRVRIPSASDFCMTDDIFLLADFIGRQNRATLSIV